MNDTTITLSRDSALLVSYALSAGIACLALHSDQGGYVGPMIGDHRLQDAINFLVALHRRILKSCLIDTPDESIIVQTETAASSTRQPE